MWIVITFLAVMSQVVRNVFSKKLIITTGPFVITLSRFLYAIPIIGLSYFIISNIYGFAKIISWEFYLFAFGMGIFQIFANICLVKLFHYKNFSISLALIKTETIIIAILGIVFLNEKLSFYAWIGIFTTFVGLFFASISRNKITLSGIKESLICFSSLLALLAGAFFAISTIFLKKAFLFINGPTKVIISIHTLFIVLIIQVIILLPIIFIRYRDKVKTIFKKAKYPVLIGFFSGIGSFFWFTAFSLTFAAYVRTIGQTEFIFGIFFTLKYFKEKIFPLEIFGMILVVIGSIIIMAL